MFIPKEAKRFAVINYSTNEVVRYSTIKRIPSRLGTIPGALPMVKILGNEMYIIVDTRSAKYSERQIDHIAKVYRKKYWLVDNSGWLDLGGNTLKEIKEHLGIGLWHTYPEVVAAAKSRGYTLLDIAHRHTKYIAIDMNGNRTPPMKMTKLAKHLDISNCGAAARGLGGISYGVPINGYIITYYPGGS